MSAVIAPIPAVHPWRTALCAFGAVVLALVLLYLDTVSAMVGIWSRSDTFAHAFLVPPISLWLIWRQRASLAALTPRPGPPLLMLLLLAAAATMWLLSSLVHVNAGMQFAWVAMLVLAVPVVLGLQVAWTILFPLLFLFFAVPIGDFLLPLMMDWTADFTVSALRLSGIPVYREGMQFVIPSGSWSVVEACSGVRYLIASFMVGTLFAYLNYRSWKRRAVFMLISILVPVVANWLRAYIIVMLGHHSGNKIAVGVDHLIYGWVFFGVVIMIMFLIGARWSEPDAQGEAGTTALTAAERGSPPTARLLIVTAGALALLLAPPLVLQGGVSSSGAQGAPRLNLPAQLSPGWAMVADPALQAYEPEFENPVVVARSVYGGAPGRVGAYVAYYRQQGETSKLVSSVNTLVASDNHEWNLVASTRHRFLMDGEPLAVRSARVLGAERPGSVRAQLVVWQVYWVGGQWVAGDARAKLVGAWAQLRGQGDDGAALVLHTQAETVPEGHAVLEQFMRDNRVGLQSMLAQARPGH
jgi:exosortase A